MPQLQTDFFVSEFLWLFIFFVGTYVLLKYKVLPSIVSIFKVRIYVQEKLTNTMALAEGRQAHYNTYLFKQVLRVYEATLRGQVK